MRKAIFVALFGVILAACGGEDTSSRDAFVGTWSVSGTTTVNASGDTSVTNATGTATIIAGTSGDMIVLKADTGGCNIPAKVSGNTATVQAGFSCDPSSDGSATLTFNSGTLVLNGSVITVNASGSVRVVQNGATATGTFSMAQSFAKVGK
jgi:hypothetical protein